MSFQAVKSLLVSITRLEPVRHGIMDLIRSTMFTVCVLLTGVMVAAFDSQMPFYVKPNYGVLFREMGLKLYASQSAIDAVFNIKRPTWPRYKTIKNVSICKRAGDPQIFVPKMTVSDPLYNYTREFHRLSDAHLTIDCMTLQADINDRINMHNSNLQEIGNATASLNSLVRQSTVRNITQKRAVLGFLGDALGSIFGIATEDQIQNLYDHISVLSTNTKASIAETQKLRTSIGKIVSVNNERFSKVWTALDGTRDFIQNKIREAELWRVSLGRTMSEQIRYLKHRHSWILELLDLNIQISTAIQMQAQISSHLNIWIDSMIILSQNRVPPHIITPAILYDHLKVVARTLAKRTVIQKLIHSHKDLAFYYSEKVATVLTVADDIYIHLKIPISDKFMRLAIYNIDVFPITTHNNEDVNSEKGYTMLQSEFAYIAITENKQFYQLLTAEDIQLCQTNLHGNCPVLAVLKDRSKVSCPFAIFINDPGAIKSSCQFKYFHERLPSYVKRAYANTYLIASPDGGFRLDCKDSIKHYESTNYAIIKVPCGCKLTVREYYAAEAVTNCNDHYEVQIGYPLNIPQLNAFKLDDTISKLSSIPVMNTTPVLPIPNLSDWKGFTELSERDRQMGVSLDEMANDLINAPIRYLDDLYPSPFASVFDTLNWQYIVIMSVSLTWFLVLSLLIVVIFFKLRSLATILVLLERIRQAETKLVTNPQQNSDQQIPSFNINAQIEADLNLIAVIVTLVAIQLIVFVAYKLYKHMQNQGCKESCPKCVSKVCLEMVNAELDVQIPLVEIPFALWEVTSVNIPVINSVELSNTWFWKMQVDVIFDKPLTVTGFGHSYKIRLPSSVKVPLDKSRSVSKLIKQKDKVKLISFIRIVNKCMCSLYVTSFDVQGDMFRFPIDHSSKPPKHQGHSKTRGPIQ